MTVWHERWLVRTAPKVKNLGAAVRRLALSSSMDSPSRSIFLREAEEIDELAKRMMRARRALVIGKIKLYAKKIGKYALFAFLVTLAFRIWF